MPGIVAYLNNEFFSQLEASLVRDGAPPHQVQFSGKNGKKWEESPRIPREFQ